MTFCLGKQQKTQGIDSDYAHNSNKNEEIFQCVHIEDKIFDYCKNDVDKREKLFVKLTSLNKDTEKFDNFLYSILDKYKVNIAIELM